MGYDVYNTDGVAESYKEVVFEDKIRIRDNGTDKLKSPDYSFRLSGIKKLFFVEAKKPNVDIQNNEAGAYQIRRYGWSARLPISIITNFKDFIVYDCTKKPSLHDKPSYAIRRRFNYKDYVNQWHDIWNIFSKEAVLKGDFDRFLNSPDNKKGNHTVDEAFLETLDGIRTLLAENINNDNKDLKDNELNFIVQQTLDRIIFLRICEDRGVEPYGSLKNCLYGNFYESLIKEFDNANAKYNSGLFDFTKDLLTKTIQVNNKIIKSIIEDLYYPNCPYEFSVLEVDILGRAYEQFLGKTITINSKGKTVVELKPDVRKAGGVYYTPQYIVHYIVKNTIDELINEKTPQEVSDIKIVDPACGSGSFLLGAYQYLIDWHKDYYQKNKSKKNPIKPDGSLTIEEKKKILVNNIFGVDIDTNAVEVTKLSLLLKCMEDEGVETLKQLELFHERLLPNIDDNIKSGNSLIDTDYYSNQLDFGAERKIKPFNWHSEFPSIFKKGGFDIVIGNPPYIKEYTSRESFEAIKKSHLVKYYQGKMDLWYFFVCYGIDILKTNGHLGFIVPNNWTTNAGATILRNKILNDSVIKTIIDFSNYMVFNNASIQTMILILEKKFKNNYQFEHRKILSNKPTLEIALTTLNAKKGNGFKILKPNIKKEKLLNSFLTFNDSSTNSILDKIKTNANLYLAENEVANGIHPHYDFVSKSIADYSKGKLICGEGIFALSHAELKKIKLTKKELTLIKPYYTTEQLSRYYVDTKNKYWIIYTTSEFKNPQSILPYPNIKKHLDRFKTVITSDNKPYGLHRARDERFFGGESIIVQRKCPNRPSFSYTDFDCYVSATFYIIKTDRINLKYLTGLLNSKLIAFWLKHQGKMQGNNYQIDKEPLLKIPIIAIQDKKLEGIIIDHVNQLTILNKDLQGLTLHEEQARLKKKIDYFENKIDQTVYQLYNLSEEEINIIEDNFKVS
ncbi:MAG: N-6 DNA methylase [Phycisphaerales bacterium]|nr:N-6 DNA methylase [Phycisphaerales bacterium]